MTSEEAVTDIEYVSMRERDETVENPNLRRASLDDTVWRYMDYRKFMWFLQTEQLHFHRANDFSDPYEGQVPKALKEIWKSTIVDDWGENQNHADNFTKYIESFQYQTYVNCWHHSEIESYQMWQAYSGDGKGIAIKSSIKKLVKNLNETQYGPANYGDVVYVDFESGHEEIASESIEKLREVVGSSEGDLGPHISQSDLFRLKRKEYAGENEFRLSYFLNLGESEWEEEPYVDINIEIDEIIDEVRVGPGTKQWVVDSIKQAIENRSDLDLSSEDVIQSELGY